MKRWWIVLALGVMSWVGNVWGQENATEERTNQSVTAEALYEAMLEHAPSANYQGIFTHQSGNHMQSVEIVHGVHNGEIWERMLHLDGATREILRRGEDLYCVHSDARVEQLQHQNNSLFGSKKPGAIRQLSKGYHFSVLGQQRVAGRLVVGLQLTPKDGTRHFYQMWLDAQTYVPLRTELIEKTGKVLERYQFNFFNPVAEVQADQFDPRTNGAKLAQAEESEVLKATADDVLEWRLNWVPAGFVDQAVEGYAPKLSARRIYSDGIVMFSVYVEQVDEIKDEGSAQSGPTVLSVQHKQWHGQQHRITVVGEIPLATAQRIGQSVELL